MNGALTTVLVILAAVLLIGAVAAIAATGWRAYSASAAYRALAPGTPGRAAAADRNQLAMRRFKRTLLAAGIILLVVAASLFALDPTSPNFPPTPNPPPLPRNA
ncbi:hypothetical protein [Tsukamurella spumae]|uniref:Uncharacterized protein n=1 Tax=Tsukamurella spumae TaxID=44753 RepID=A0A846X2T9_9ACTN|nr:hypothetical protein [Tsukamurella spumae]NKY19473.1 hypothetical protein [Tsukamurella spumae]